MTTLTPRAAVRDILIALAIVLALLSMSIPAHAESVESPNAMPPDCLPWYDGGNSHHVISPWLSAALSSGQFKVKVAGASAILWFRAGACGWMFAKFASGQFITNFLPTRGLAYIESQMVGGAWKAVNPGWFLRVSRIAAGSPMFTTLLLTPISLWRNKGYCKLPGASAWQECQVNG